MRDLITEMISNLDFSDWDVERKDSINRQDIVAACSQQQSLETVGNKRMASDIT